MRLACALALSLAALGAHSEPASATANWDYVCKAGDAKIDLDVNLTFNQGTAGKITVSAVDAAVRAGSKDRPQEDATTFAADDIEQFWIGDDVFRISLSRYNGGEPEPVQLRIDTACQDQTCNGTYRYFRNGVTMDGKVTCNAGEKG